MTGLLCPCQTPILVRGSHGFTTSCQLLDSFLPLSDVFGLDLMLPNFSQHYLAACSKHRLVQPVVLYLDVGTF